MNRKIFFSLGLGLLVLLIGCRQKRSAASGATAAFENETDFICNMKVQADYTDTCHYKGKVYAFCSKSCKEEFQVDPDTYLSKEANQ